MDNERTELDPKCLTGGQEAFAITNRGELIPCCWLDNQVNRRDPDYIKLLIASHIQDYDSIEEILFTDEWLEFQDNLKKGIGFTICHLVCKKRDSPQHKRETFYGEDNDKKYVKET